MEISFFRSIGSRRLGFQALVLHAGFSLGLRAEKGCNWNAGAYAATQSYRPCGSVDSSFNHPKVHTAIS